MPISTPIVAHDDQVAGDVLTGITVNHVWRQYLAEMLVPLCMESSWQGTDDDVQDAVAKAIDLLVDLYTPEEPQVATHGFRLSLDADQSLPMANHSYYMVWRQATGGFEFDTDSYLSGATDDHIQIPPGLGGLYIFSISARHTSATSHTSSISVVEFNIGDVTPPLVNSRELGVPILTTNASQIAAVSDFNTVRVRVRSNDANTTLERVDELAQVTTIFSAVRIADAP